MAQDRVGRILTAVLADPGIAALARGVVADPPDQARFFRGRRRDSDESCVLKVGLGELEALWMPAVDACADDIVPAVLGHGSLAGADVEWLLLEDLPFRGRSDRPGDVAGVMRATARFQQVAAGLPLPTYPIDVAFLDVYARLAIDEGCPGPAAEVVPRLPGDDSWLRSLDGHVIGHGDVHFWNAVAATADGPWRLIDPIPRIAHWAWDAAYAQVTSGVPDSPDLISVLADERRGLGLRVDDGEQLDRIRTILLGWSSLLWWAILPARRDEHWWRAQIEGNVAALAELPA